MNSAGQGGRTGSFALPNVKDVFAFVFFLLRLMGNEFVEYHFHGIGDNLFGEED